MDGTEERKDTSQDGDTSSDTKETSKEAPDYSKESQKKAVDDALSAAGRDAKSITDTKATAEKLLENAKNVSEKAVEAQKTWQSQRDEEELEINKDKPDAIARIKDRQKQDKVKSDLAKRTQELDERESNLKPQLDEVATNKRERNALEVAIKYNVAYEQLLKFTDGSVEQMEELAKSLPKKGDSAQLNPDSNDSVGGGDLSAEDKLKKRYDKMFE